MNTFILTLVLMASTSGTNRAVATVTMEYANKASCEKALAEHVNSVKAHQQGMVNVVLANCTNRY